MGHPADAFNVKAGRGGQCNVRRSAMIAMRQPHEFAIHMGAGLKNGLTLKEIEEVLIQALLLRWQDSQRMAIETRLRERLSRPGRVQISAKTWSIA